jgi:hypothetical protein
LFIFLSGEYAGGVTAITGAAEKNDSEVGSDLKGMDCSRRLAMILNKERDSKTTEAIAVGRWTTGREKGASDGAWGDGWKALTIAPPPIWQRPDARGFFVLPVKEWTKVWAGNGGCWGNEQLFGA